MSSSSNGELLYFKYSTERNNLPEASVKPFEEYYRLHASSLQNFLHMFAEQLNGQSRNTLHILKSKD